ncbi:MAG: N-6 DNA methylase, partial [Candidatus Delongbacteria bacterium]|nr:N-6 DNA methylase [Candidatus Delongbacteria bacterium]
MITIDKAAELLEVSVATIRNWIKSGLLIRKNNGISKISIELLLEDINSGKIDKLNSRANKIRSSKKFIPIELISENNEIDRNVRYQSNFKEGSKSQKGSYYTPENIVLDAIKVAGDLNGKTVCDPCCGSGSFLRSFQGAGLVLGYDSDNQALKIAKHYLRKSENYRLENINSLTSEWAEKIDAVITNPPWGARYSSDSKKKLKYLYPEAGSTDSLEYFILKSMRSVKNKGFLSFVLPESVLFVRHFWKLRENLLKNSKILNIITYGRVFTGVFSNVIRIDLINSKPASRHYINANGRKIKQSDLTNEPEFRFNIEISKDNRKILDMMTSKPFVILKDNAEWSLGIVTGNNFEFVSDKSTSKHCVPVITGKNIHPYSIDSNRKYLNFDRSRLQQVPKYPIYAKKKLVYKFISNRLVFAYDNSEVITLNSANVMIPHMENYPLRVIM